MQTRSVVGEVRNCEILIPYLMSIRSSSFFMQSEVHATNAHTLVFRFLFISYIFGYLYKSTYIYEHVKNRYCHVAAREIIGMPERKLSEYHAAFTIYSYNILLFLNFYYHQRFYIYIYNFRILNCLTHTQYASVANYSYRILIWQFYATFLCSIINYLYSLFLQ